MKKNKKKIIMSTLWLIFWTVMWVGYAFIFVIIVFSTIDGEELTHQQLYLALLTTFISLIVLAKYIPEFIVGERKELKELK